ncbi:MAG: helix-turn-helix transcriptional regulator [Deltaproteobacteria bacterium]|nr:helix-turn-helix transcriptional regulator [Deltaproteobacteria bacterium]
MARPSDPLLDWLRKKLDEKGMNTARIAEVAGLPRARVRKLLVGAEPMLVDELLAITKALELTPTELAAAGEISDPEPPGLRVAHEEEEPEGPRVDAWGNQPRQLFEVAFALGCDFFFLLDGAQLEGTKLPASVIAQYRGRDLPIKLDAKYHAYNDPKYDDASITLSLSFDALYTCRFPWSAIKQVIFFPVAPEPDEPDEPDAPGPQLRLVT